VIKTLGTYTNDLLHLFFPHHCTGCGSDVVEDTQMLCLQCLAKLPETNFFEVAGNPVEKTFYGRLQVQSAGAAYYFTKDSLVQHLVTELKYLNNPDIGIYLGKLTAYQMQKSDRFNSVECIIPLPLNNKKLWKRGYNQAALICEGLSSVLNVPVITNAVSRKLFTETQTKKDRVSRWQSMQDVFEISNTSLLENKHVLLVDDIITTGATLEACGTAMLQVSNLKLSIATVAWTI
jgi:ComF family protein